jgi:hypothetical protein
LKRTALLLGLLVATLGLGTWIALESGEVVVLGTRAPDGSLRRTRVWLAEEDGALWIEAATAERDWYRDLLREPRVTVWRDGAPADLLAEPVAEPGGRERIRALLRARYGWRDVWVGALQDTSRSRAVRLWRPAGGS